MDTRLILQIVLGVVVALVVVVGVLIIVALTKEADTVIVQQVAEDLDEEERVNPWAGQGEAAIALVKRFKVKSDPGLGDEERQWSVGDLVEDETFQGDKLELGSTEATGWEVEWWGETQYGPYFYRVRYGFRDEGITIGPTWLVNLKSQEVVPKNVLAEVVTDPNAGVDSDYFGQARQVVSAIINHNFPSGINLGGALLAYFQEREEADEEDRVLGWTVSHSRANLFRVYFQWIDRGEAIYAEFEFDFDERALRPVNLQASEIMRVGESFEPIDRVGIMPQNYDPDETIPAHRWQGPARDHCRRRSNRKTCQALATVLDNSGLIETLEWTLTTHADSAEAFRRCQEPQDGKPPRCRWTANEKEDNLYRVDYIYDLGDGEERISWDVNVADDELVPGDVFSELAYRAVFPRS